MKYSIVVLTVIFMFVMTMPRMSAQEAVLSSGGEASGSGGTASFSIGQVAYTYKTGTGGSVSEGVQQAYIAAICALQQVNIVQGWSIISSYILADNPDMLSIIEDIDSDITIMKDNVGNIVLPAFNFNQIGNWDVTQGYQVKGLNTTDLNIGCAKVEPDETPIALPVGWSMISYLRNNPMDAIPAFTSITGDIFIVKDEIGNIYLPSFSFNQIGNLVPGKGYQIKMTNASILTYPANSARVAGSTYNEPGETTRFIIEKNTGNNASIFIPEGSIEGLEAGDEIGVYSSRGELTGSARYNGGHMAITVWGNDASISEERNMMEGEPYHYRMFKSSENKEYELLVEYQSGGPNFTSNAISILKSGIAPELGIENALFATEDQLSIFPNPAKSILNATIWLQDASSASIKIYDLSGHLVLSPFNRELVQGHSTMEIDISSLSNGNYIYRVETENKLFNGKFLKL